MIDQFLGICRNTFFESIRQPIVLVVLFVATLLIVLANPLSAFTMEDDQRMLIDIGLATVFIAGAVLSAFVATSVLTREIENKTVLTVVSKPVGRPIFILGKFVGVAAAMLISMAFMTFVFLLVDLHGVLQTVRDPIHLPAIAFGVGATLLGIAAATWANYFFDKVWTSSVIVLTTPLLAIGYGLALFFEHDFSIQPIGTDFKPDLWLVIAALAMAILVLTAIAMAISARCGQILTLVLTLGIFMGGMLSDWMIGRPIETIKATWLERAVEQGLTREETYRQTFRLQTGETQVAPIEEVRQVPEVALTSMAEGSELIQYGLLQTAYSIVPNFQVLWLSDALTQYRVVPPSYVIGAMVYGLTYMLAALGMAIILFQRREVG